VMRERWQDETDPPWGLTILIVIQLDLKSILQLSWLIGHANQCDENLEKAASKYPNENVCITWLIVEFS
jgi:hypothetical protein